MKAIKDILFALVVAILFTLLVLPHLDAQNPGTAMMASGNIVATASACNLPTGSIAVDCVQLNLPVNAGAAVITISGTYVGTEQFEANPDGSAWISINGLPISGTQTAVTSATTANAWRFNVSGIQSIRARASAYTSGTAVTSITASPAAAQ